MTGATVGDLKRQDAVIQAKGTTDSFVVLLSFEIDSFQNGTIILNSPDLQIEYQILAPQSGKKRTKGKIYFQAIGGGRMRKSEWPGGTPIRITPEAAGIEAADHVHDWLRLDETRKRQNQDRDRTAVPGRWGPAAQYDFQLRCSSSAAPNLLRPSRSTSVSPPRPIRK